jgi:hypothetical protein
MVKSIIPMSNGDFIPSYEIRLRELLGHIPALRIQSLKKGVLLDRKSNQRAEWMLKAQLGGKPWTLIIQAKSLGQPLAIRGATLQLRHDLSLLSGNNKYGVIVAPFISPESARICEDAGMGYADLSGNARIAFSNVYIETRAAENAFKQRKETKSLFSNKAQRIVRVLLQGPLHPWKVSALANAAQVSLGWVSAVKQELLAQEWAVNESQGLMLTRPSALLDEWVKVDRWKERTEIRQYSSIYFEPIDVAKRLEKALGKTRHAFTQWFAARLRQPYTETPVVTAYVDDWPDEGSLELIVSARRVTEGGRIWLVKPRDEGVFFPSQKKDGFELVSDAQIYLDLLGAGLRADEQAAELRKQKDFCGGWN